MGWHSAHTTHEVTYARRDFVTEKSVQGNAWARDYLFLPMTTFLSSHLP